MRLDDTLGNRSNPAQKQTKRNPPAIAAALPAFMPAGPEERRGGAAPPSPHHAFPTGARTLFPTWLRRAGPRPGSGPELVEGC